MTVRITDKASAVLLGLLAEEANGDGLGLWLEVTGVAGDRYTYDLHFAQVAEAGPDDLVEEDGGLAIVVPDESVAKVAGATLELGPGGELIRATRATRATRAISSKLSSSSLGRKVRPSSGMQ